MYNYYYREKKELQQANVAKLDKLVGDQMAVVAKLKMEQRRLVGESLHEKDQVTTLLMHHKKDRAKTKKQF